MQKNQKGRKGSLINEVSAKTMASFSLPSSNQGKKLFFCQEIFSSRDEECGNHDSRKKHFVGDNERKISVFFLDDTSNSRLWIEEESSMGFGQTALEDGGGGGLQPEDGDLHMCAFSPTLQFPHFFVVVCACTKGKVYVKVALAAI